MKLTLIFFWSLQSIASVISSSYPVTLDCIFKINNQNKYQCETLKNFTVTHGSDHIGNVTGQHQNGLKNEDVTILVLKKSPMNFIPNNFSDFFPFIDLLVINNDDLKQIKNHNLLS